MAMTPDEIARTTSASIAEAVSVERRGLDDYRVCVPFSFADGDELKVILKSGSDGRLVMSGIAPEDIGPSVYTFSQALLKVGDMAMWRRESRKSAFMDDFRIVIPECVGKRNYTFDYSDIEGVYIVDCLIECPRLPVHVYAVYNDSRAKDAVISMHHYNSYGVMPLSCAVFEDMEEMGNKTLTQVSEVA